MKLLVSWIHLFAFGSGMTDLASSSPGALLTETSPNHKLGCTGAPPGVGAFSIVAVAPFSVVYMTDDGGKEECGVSKYHGLLSSYQNDWCTAGTSSRPPTKLDLGSAALDPMGSSCMSLANNTPSEVLHALYHESSTGTWTTDDMAYQSSSSYALWVLVLFVTISIFGTSLSLTSPTSKNYKISFTRWGRIFHATTSIILLCSSCANALDITGPYTVNTLVTWSLSDSPVYVSGLVNIDTGGVLSIRPGVQVIFQDANSGITNNDGTLLVLGEPGNRVSLKPSGDLSWQGIKFETKALSAFFDEADGEFTYDTGSVIQHTDIYFAGSGSYPALDFGQGAVPFVLGVDLIECVGPSGYSIYVNNLQGFFVAKFVNLRKNSTENYFQPSNAFFIRGTSNENGITVLENVDNTLVSTYALQTENIARLVVRDCNFQGRTYFYSIGEMLFTGNIVSASRGGNALFAQYMGRNNVISPIVVTDNTLIGRKSTSQAVLYINYVYSTSNVTVERNTILNGDLEFYASSYNNPVSISSNTIRESTSGALYIYGGSDNEGEFLVTGNLIENCISSYSDLVVLDTRSQAFEFRGNRIVSSQGRNVFRLDGSSSYDTAYLMFSENEVEETTGASALVSFDYYPFTTFTRNMFVNCSAPASVSLGSSFWESIDFLKLPENFWGNFQEDVIGLRQTVHDGLTSNVDTIVVFQTVLSGPSLESTVEDVYLPSLNLSDSSVGGIMTSGDYELQAGQYVANLTLFVAGNATLILHPGVGIAFAPGTFLRIEQEGQLLLQGTRELPISLSARDETSSWGGVVIDSIHGTRVNHTSIENVKTGISHTSPASLHLSSVNISSAENYCVYSDSSSSNGNVEENTLSIEDGTFTECTSDAVYIRRRDSFSFEHSSVSGGRGIDVDQPTKDVLIAESTFENTLNYGVEINSDSISVVNNTFFHTEGAVSASCSFCKASIIGNKAYGSFSNSYTYVFYVYTYYSDSTILEDNLVMDWKVRYAAMYVYFRSRNNIPTSGLTMSRNRFTNVTAKNILDISYENSFAKTNIQNIFERDLEATSSSEPGLLVIRRWPSADGSEPSPTLQGNIFTSMLRNDTDQYYMYVTQSSTSVPEIDVSESYWNSGDVLDVLDHNFDGRDSIGVSKLHYNPFLVSLEGPLVNATPPFFRPPDVLSGQLEEGVELILSSGNYTSKGSLVIDGRLILDPGVTITMDGAASLSIGKGNVIAKGTVENPIVFQAADSAIERWGQILIAPNYTSEQDIVFENVHISGAGSSNAPALETMRGGMYVNVSVIDCAAGGIKVSGTGGTPFFFGGLSSIDTTGYFSYSYYNLQVGEDADLVVEDSIFSSQCSSEIYASGNSKLRLTSVSIQPKHRYSKGLLLRNRFAAIEKLVFNSSLVTTTSYRPGRPVEVNGRDLDFSMRDSLIDTGYLRDASAVYVYTYGSLSSFRLEDNRFLGDRAVEIVDISYAENAVVTGNHFSVSQTSAEAMSSSGVKLIVSNNTWLDIACSRSCLNLRSSDILMESNILYSLASQGPYGVVTLDSDVFNVSGNLFEECGGYSLLHVDTSVPGVQFEGNAVLNSSLLENLVSTTTLFEEVDGGILFMADNFWGTSDFSEIRSKTVDSLVDASLASIEYPSIFINENLKTTIASPPSGSILDDAAKTIGGTVFDPIVIRIPSGLYYGTSSLILNHPDAQIVMEAGVRIMFRPKATIHVRQGTLQIMGTEGNKVVLAPVSRFLSEYSAASNVQNSSEWGGVWFGPDSTSSELLDTDFIAGSIIRNCEIVNAGFGGSSAAIEMQSAAVSLDRVRIEGSGKNGVDVSGLSDSDLSLKHVDIVGANLHGLTTSRFGGMLTVEYASIRQAGSYGLYLSNHGDVRISESVFSGNGNDQIYSNYGKGYLNMTSSNISDAPSERGLRVYHSNSPGLSVNIVSSDFTNLRYPLLINSNSYENDSTSVALSNFLSNACLENGCHNIGVSSYRNIVFEGNTIADNVAGSIVYLRTLNNWRIRDPFVSLQGNVLRNNRAASGTSGQYAVLSMNAGGASSWDIQGNEFSNPTSLFEVTVSYSGDMPNEVRINGTSNLFNFETDVTAALIDERIHDGADNPSKPIFIFEPFLPSDYVPLCANNCTGRGSCVFPGFCVCGVNWGGPDCNVPTCQTLDFCSGHGECIGEGSCLCNQGWIGATCSTANCTERNDCSIHGSCLVPNVCTCDAAYIGDDCDGCVDNYRKIGFECFECPNCRNGGVCNDKAQCECVYNFDGTLCDTCKPGFFGPACEPLPFIESVTPNDAVDQGGVSIRATGINFGLVANSTSSLFCDFSSVETVPGILVEDNVIECSSPRIQLINSGKRTTVLRIFVGGVVSVNVLPFTFYGLCPQDECVNGFCSFGRCSCYFGWGGNSCDNRIEPPTILSPPPEPFQLVEGKPFEYAFSLLSGSQPVEFAIAGKPPTGMSITQDGVLTWPQSIADGQIWSVRVQAMNELSTSFATLSLEVKPSYFVRVSTVVTEIARPSPSLPFSFETIDAETLTPVGDKLAVLWVQNSGSGSRRKVLVRTNVFGTFIRTFQPYSSDAGHFLYGGEHPDVDDLSPQGVFSIQGVDASRRSYYFSGFPLESSVVDEAFTFTFLGGTFSDLSVSFDNVPGVQIEGVLSQNATSETANTVSMALNIQVEAALTGRIYFTLTTAEGISLFGNYVYIDVRDRSPKFRISRSKLNVQMVRGGVARYESVEIQNIGNRESGEIQLIIPDQAIIRSVTDGIIPGLAVDEKTTVTFSFIAVDSLAIGDYFTGRIGFVSDETSVSLDYRATVVSDIPASLIVVSQNEATFFDTSAPNLPGVEVRIRSLTTGTTLSGTTDTNGTLIFPDLVEDLYEVTAQKLGHSSFRTETLLVAPGQTVSAFLQYEVVSYTFSVVPVPVLDKYVIEVETTFKTDVPKPVVVWEPAVLDWEGIQSGLVDEIQVTATNYGLIAARNLTYSWPTYWENAAFILPEDEDKNSRVRTIGDIPANSSVTFPVKIEQIVRFAIPEGRAELRSSTNDVLFVPEGEDSSWETGPDFIVAPAEDPINGQMFVKLDENGTMVYLYEFATGDLHQIIYQYNETEGDLDVIGVDIIRNTTLPEDGEERRLVESLETNSLQSLVTSNSQSRELLSVDNPLDCLQFGACIACQIAAAKYKAKKAAACRLLRRKCNKMGKFSGPAKYVCGKLKDYCDNLDPCELICKDPLTIKGEISFTCGPLTLKASKEFEVPNPGSCLKLDPPKKTASSVSPSGGRGGCSRCGGGFYGGLGGGGGGCTLSGSASASRRLTGLPVPDHVVPTHRALLDGCPSCSGEALKETFQAVDIFEGGLLSAETAIQTCVNTARGEGGMKGIFPCIVIRGLAIIRLAPLLAEVVACQLAQEPCYRPVDLASSPGLVNLLVQARRVSSFAGVLLLPFSEGLTGGPESALNATTLKPEAFSDFGDHLVSAVADESSEGRFISSIELEGLKAIDIGSTLSSEDIAGFASSWNTSLQFWEEGIFRAADLPANYTGAFFDLSVASELASQFQTSRDSLRAEGFSGFGDAWLTAVEGQQFEEAKKLAGICATVKVKIEQELTLTRTGFEARLEVSNSGNLPLENVSVALRASPYGNATFTATNLFVFDEPILTGISATDGTGTIDADSVGKATWLIIPLTEAAPQFDTKYDIGGLLQYSIDGVEYSQSLASDTITVQPDPQLYLTYFHSRLAYSDDPFTLEIEPAVPFHLGLLIENRGYGDARDLKIASSQPEIVENEKGLLVDFSIVGARLGNEPTSNTLDIDFGNIGALSNEIGVWDLVSSLRGEFFNMSATFQYLGPIDDMRLSLIESVDIFELTHLVRMTGDHPAMSNNLGYVEDGLDDFLVNKNPDAFYLPDSVFTSDTRSTTLPVSSVIDQAEMDDPIYLSNIFGEGRVQVHVHHNLTDDDRGRLNDWVYTRFDDPMKNSDYILQSATRTDVNYTLMEQANSWQTAWSEYLLGGSIEELDYIHLFDFGVAQTYVLEYALQQPVSNLRITDQAEHTLTIAWDMAAGASSSYVVIRPTGYGDEYNKAAKEFTQVESIVIRNLIANTSYTIQVFTGREGKYESTGSEVVGLTLGNTTCGNAVLDTGEECDDGDSISGNCTAVCFQYRPGRPTQAPSMSPSLSPTKSLAPSGSAAPTPIFSESPSVLPSMVPSKDPSSSPSISPTQAPTAGEQPDVADDSCRGSWMHRERQRFFLFGSSRCREVCVEGSFRMFVYRRVLRYLQGPCPSSRRQLDDDPYASGYYLRRILRLQQQ